MPSPSQLATARARTNGEMTETVTAGIWKKTADETTGDDVETLETEFYAGMALVKYPTLTVSDPVAGGAQHAVSQLVVKIPTGSPRVPVGAEFRVTASTSDELLVGRAYKVDASPQSGQTTSHRYPVTEQQ